MEAALKSITNEMDELFNARLLTTEELDELYPLDPGEMMTFILPSLNNRYLATLQSKLETVDLPVPFHLLVSAVHRELAHISQKVKKLRVNKKGVIAKTRKVKGRAQQIFWTHNPAITLRKDDYNLFLMARHRDSQVTVELYLDKFAPLRFGGGPYSIGSDQAPLRSLPDPDDERMGQLIEAKNVNKASIIDERYRLLRLYRAEALRRSALAVSQDAISEEERQKIILANSKKTQRAHIDKMLEPERDAFFRSLASLYGEDTLHEGKKPGDVVEEEDIIDEDGNLVDGAALYHFTTYGTAEADFVA